MDLKKKIFSFISDIRDTTAGRQGAEGETGEHTAAWTADPELILKTKGHTSCEDPRVNQEAIDSISASYFEDEQFDIIQYELEKLPERLELSMLEERRQVFNVQLQSVSRKVSELVLDNHPAYAAELQRVMQLQGALDSAACVCSQGRRSLAGARQGFTAASLALVANYRKRQQLSALLKSLRTIKTLQRTDVRLRELLEEEDYPRAIQLCLECQKAASTYRHYRCISELSSKLADTLELIEESMDVALSRTCSQFDERQYARIQTAYRLLDKTQTAVDQLQMHYTSSVLNTAFTKVLGYVELCAGSTDGAGSFQKRQYADLCKYMSAEMFVPCLIDLCKALWALMNNYHRTLVWHERTLRETSAHTDSGEAGSQQYIERKLEHGRQRIWTDVQHKVKVFLCSTDLSAFKYDDFIQVLDVVNRLMQVGEEFSGGSRSDMLDDSVRKQSINYFRSYHRLRLDELRMFLENEGWEACPVKPGFNLLMLQEFKFLRVQQQLALNSSAGPQNAAPGPQPAISESDPTLQGPTDSGGGSEGGGGWAVLKRGGVFERYGGVKGGSPFDFQPEDDEKEDVMDFNRYAGEGGGRDGMWGGRGGADREGTGGANDSDSDDDVPDELKLDFVDERTGETPAQLSRGTGRGVRRSYRGGGVSQQAPIIANTTLTVCRLFGKYMQMMQVLKSISFDVTIAMSQLFDYYLYAAFSFFSAEKHTTGGGGDALGGSSKLRSTLKRIKENLILDEDWLQQQQQQGGVGGAEAPTTASPVEDRRDRVAHPFLSPSVDLSHPDTLYGLPSRIVATQSLIFLADQLKLLRAHLEGAIPPAKQAFLHQFYSQTLSTAGDLDGPVCRAVAQQAVRTEASLALMGAVRWDVRDIMSQHSPYVDLLLKELRGFEERVGGVGRYIAVPPAVRGALWTHVVHICTACFVEGFAGAKKCTNEGRALMQLDFQQFLIKLEKLTDLRPIPGREYVETYIKAYYLPEAQLESWVYEHKEYSSKQLLALINCLGHIGKKSRQKLMTTIEEMDRTRR